MFTSSYADGALDFTDTTEGKVMRRWTTSRGPCLSVSLSDNDALIAAASHNGKLMLFDPRARGQDPAQMISAPYTDALVRVQWIGGDRLLTLSMAGEMCTYDMRKGTAQVLDICVKQGLHGSASGAQGVERALDVVFSPDTRMLGVRTQYSMWVVSTQHWVPLVSIDLPVPMAQRNGTHDANIEWERVPLSFPSDTWMMYGTEGSINAWDFANVNKGKGGLIDQRGDRIMCLSSSRNVQSQIACGTAGGSISVYDIGD
ncbi:hypothetical protein KIPB_011097 [Kipferlia bialata]|uniref:Uncharacterized protein n=1 Tax=Kipferlia bialata TaxID=797122 RepID=A0A9K3GNF8_9EUKA|nr:hypothetical protein KIPB_011097 [Kipferlia bialata]|eukprot:g11097.t1